MTAILDIHAREVLDSRGTLVHPLSTDGVLEKARALCETVDPGIDLDSIVGVIKQFETGGDAGDLTELLVVPNFEDGMQTLVAVGDGAWASAE